ncbi:MAG TPA: hypothetical protein VGR81_12415 [Candidatus Acidoferrales bacterium]|nr:hypothetical protein [Candidatus Acidoferrales bacterium]
MTLLTAILLSLAVLIFLVWLLFPPRVASSTATVEALEIEKLLPLHSRHFPQISQILCNEDREFMSRHSPKSIETPWRRQRRKILRQYLNSLAEDFTRLERLARLASALSPELNKAHQWEWLRLGLQFRVMYRMLAIRIAFDSVTPKQLVRITNLISGLSGELETRMSQIAGIMPSRLGPNPSN